MSIILKNSSVPDKTPLLTDLDLGELAVNTYNGKLFLKRNVSGTETIVEITTEYDNTDTQFASNTVNDTLDEIDDILNTKITSDSDATLSSIQIGDSTNNTSIGADGFITLNGDASFWKNVDFPIIMRSTGSSVPVAEVIIGNITAPRWSIGDNNICEGQLTDNSWKEESDIYWNCYIITGSTDPDDRYVSFEIEFTRANINGQLDVLTTLRSEDLLIPANTPDRTHMVINFGSTDMTGFLVGTQIYAKLTRVSPLTGSDPSGDPFCSMLRMHMECDNLGLKTINTNS